MRGGRNYSREGGIAGDSDQMDLGMRNLLGLDFRPEDVFRMASANAAEYLGLEGLDHIRPGMRACLSAWTPEYQPAWSLAYGLFTRA